MKFHLCALGCREFGSPWRFHIQTRRRNIGIALSLDGRFLTRRKDAPEWSGRYCPEHYRPAWISVTRLTPRCPDCGTTLTNVGPRCADCAGPMTPRETT